MTTIHDLGWWYWFLTVGLLFAGVFAWSSGISLAMALCVVQIAHVLWLTRDFTAFPIRVRAVYPAMLIAGLWEPVQCIHWMQLAGTTARVLVGYGLLARTLSLAPWNCRQPLSFVLGRRTYFSLRETVPPCGEVFRRISLERVQA